MSTEQIQSGFSWPLTGLEASAVDGVPAVVEHILTIAATAVLAHAGWNRQQITTASAFSKLLISGLKVCIIHHEK